MTRATKCSTAINRLAGWSCKRGPSAATAMEPAFFTVRLALPDGSSRKVNCDDDTDVSQILQAVSTKVRAPPPPSAFRRRRLPPSLRGPLELSLLRPRHVRSAGRAAPRLGRWARLCPGGARPTRCVCQPASQSWRGQRVSHLISRMPRCCGCCCRRPRAPAERPPVQHGLRAGVPGAPQTVRCPACAVPRALARPSRTVDARGRTLTPIPRVVPTAAVRRPTFTVYDRQIAGSGTHGSRGDLSAAAASSRRGARTGSAAATGAPAGSRKRWAFRILFQLPTGQVGSEQRAARARPALVVFGIESPVVCA
jgi:hypothetical protein